jgi:hypothetical protein
MLPVRRAGACRRRRDRKRTNIHLIDAKKAARRVNPGRKTRARICRVLSDIQKQLGVRMAYVYIDTRAVHIVPEIEESGHYEITLSNAQ